MRPALLSLSISLALLVAAAAGCSGEHASPTGAATASAGADQVVLVRDQRLLLRDPSGRERELLRTPPDSYPSFPAWSPGGDRIAYVRTAVQGGRPDLDVGDDIAIVTAAGAGDAVAWEHDRPGVHIQGLAWTADGQGLLFGYQRAVYGPDLTYQGQVERIERLDLQTGKPVPLIEGGAFPSLSRDGAHLAYQTRDPDGRGGIWVAAADGSASRRLVETGPMFLAMYPRIAPDGSAVAFAAVASRAGAPPPPRARGWRRLAAFLLLRAAEAHGPRLDLWHAVLADGSVRQIAALAEDEPYAAWSPDSRAITVFATGGLYHMNADGSGVRRIGDGAFNGQIDVR
jgi:dipeptidyl aminopeptidase/acylaminoacyl peptidase